MQQNRNMLLSYSSQVNLGLTLFTSLINLFAFWHKPAVSPLSCFHGGMSTGLASNNRFYPCPMADPVSSQQHCWANNTPSLSVEHWPIRAHQSFKSHSIEQCGPSRGARVGIKKMDTGAPGSDSITEALSGPSHLGSHWKKAQVGFQAMVNSNVTFSDSSGKVYMVSYHCNYLIISYYILLYHILS